MEKEGVASEEELLRPKEASVRLGVSLRTVYDLIYTGKLKARGYRSFVGSRVYWLIPSSEVERLAKEKGVTENARRRE